MHSEYEVGLSIPQRKAVVYLSRGGRIGRIQSRTRHALFVRGLLSAGKLNKKGEALALRLRKEGLAGKGGNPEMIVNGQENLARVRAYFETHLCARNVDCAKELGMRTETVSRHVKTIRAEWSDQ